MRDKYEIKRFLKASMAFIGLVCICVFLFLGFQMSGRNEMLVDQVGTLYMTSMNQRISKHFTTMLNLRLTEMDTLVETLPTADRVDSPEMRDWLEYNGKLRGFEALAYYFEDDTFEMIYGSQLAATKADPFAEWMKSGKQAIAVATDGDGTQSAVTGIPFHVSLADGRQSLAIVGRMPIEYISETLSLDDEDALMYSFIIRKNGDFVIHSADAYRENYFDRARARYESVLGKKSVEQFVTELQAAMLVEEDYNAVFIMGGDRYQLQCSSLPSSEWYVLTILPYGVLNEAVEAQGRHTFLMSFICCLVILLMLLLIFLKYSKMNHAQLEELATARQIAEEASKSKSEFLSNMSHDIRTPMNAIVGMTAIAMKNIADPARVENCLKKIALSSRHLLGLINDVLDMSKIESGKMTLSVELVSLRDIMDSIVSIVQPQIKAKQQRFDIFIYDITSENVLCDSVRLNQVLLNLLSNAIKFTPDGGAIEVALHEQASPKGSDYVRILLRVKDTGIGMSPEFKERIFDSFSREDNKRVQKTEGTGLGMAITKYIVDAMGGTITVDSTPGAGTEFNVTLDFERTDQQEEDMVLPNFTMLMVDDDQQLCESTAASLKSIGIDADWTLDGESAIQIIRQHHNKHDDYHVILLDLKLPGMDGIQTARELRKQLGNDVPILLISAYDCSEIEDEARAAGINGFLSKPLFKSTLYYGLKPYIDSSATPSAPKEKTVNFAGRHILLAEDNDLNWEIANELLQGLGLMLDRAENGEICAEMFRKSPVGAYDAILMDIRMPVKDGYEATDMIRAMNRADANLPIIAMTADAFSEDIRRCLEHGMNAHVAKPIDTKELTHVLNRFFEREGK